MNDTEKISLKGFTSHQVDVLTEIQGEIAATWALDDPELIDVTLEVYRQWMMQR